MSLLDSERQDFAYVSNLLGLGWFLIDANFQIITSSNKSLITLKEYLINNDFIIKRALHKVRLS